MRMARRAPKIAPGKNPAITAVVGNEGHEERVAVVLCVEAEEEGEATNVKVAPVVSAVVDVDFDEAFEEVAVLEVFLSNAQVVFPWHVYPKGQHALPHVGREESSFVVLTEFFGCVVAFCSCTSQTMGEM